MEHTKGYWKVETDGVGFEILDSTGSRIYWLKQADSNAEHQVSKIYARRIVACAEIPTEEIEAVGQFESPVPALRERNRELEMQRDKLLEALEKTQWGSRSSNTSWRCCPECGNSPESNRHQFECSIGNLIAEIKAGL